MTSVSSKRIEAAPHPDGVIPEQLCTAAMACLQNCPVIVLGSGASIPFGVPGMPALQKFLTDNLHPKIGTEADEWLLIQTALSNGDDLEKALSGTKITENLMRKIVNNTWDFIAKSDVDVLRQIATAKIELPLTRLLRWLTRSTHYEVTIVTTNYDRLAEYAADAAGMVHLNGFAPGYIHNRETGASYFIKRGNQRARTARLWKVHGSLDWFARNESEIVCARFTGQRPEELLPVIVTPGIQKFQLTHSEPYRSVITGADGALEAASAVICVGYGFRDEHIEPKLVDRCRDHNIPLIVIAKTLTAEAHCFLAESAGHKYLAFEEAEDGCKALTPEFPGGLNIPGKKLWDFNEFVEQFIC